MLKQRVFQIASGYEDGNDTDTLRADPLFKLAAGHAPLETGNPLACGATHSRLEGLLRHSDLYRTAKALIEQFVATYSEVPNSITLAIDHTDRCARQAGAYLLQSSLWALLLPATAGVRG